MFEEMSRHTTVDLNKQGQRGMGGKLIGHQRVKAKRRKAKPDSVIQRLLERFDPLKLNSSSLPVYSKH